MTSTKSKNRTAAQKPESTEGDLTQVSKPVKEFSNRVTFGVALLGCSLMWLAFPPVGWWLIGWIATAPFVWLVSKVELPGNRPYLSIGLAAFFYWLATFYFVPIPHWALWGGWLVVSLYMSVYLPLFVAISRVAVHRYKMPALVVAPAVWVGVEWIRSWAFTGMGMVCLSHTQYRQPVLIQISDLFGAYTLTFIMVLVATASCQYLFWKWLPRNGPVWRGMAIGSVSIGVVVSYGVWKLDTDQETDETKTLVVGLIQGSIDTEFPATELEFKEYRERRLNQYSALTLQAQIEWDDLDLIVWPESTFPIPDLLPGTDTTNFSVEESDFYNDYPERIWASVIGLPHKRAVPMLTGGVSTNFAGTTYNSALLLDRNGKISERYFKNHRVMFGEYVPFGEWIPGIQQLFPGGGVQAGTDPLAISIGEFTCMPTVCFETTVPHLVRRHVNRLAAAGSEPTVLLNLTNDGWFFGTSCLDLHLACNVFRAVENRKPHLVCANTGFSAHIDSWGRIIQQGPRRETKIIRVEVHPESEFSLYRIAGDVPVGVLGIGSLLIGIAGWFTRKKIA